MTTTEGNTHFNVNKWWYEIKIGKGRKAKEKLEYSDHRNRGLFQTQGKYFQETMRARGTTRQKYTSMVWMEARGDVIEMGTEN